MSKFPWGKVVDRFEYDFDGPVFKVIKYHPYKKLTDGCTIGRKPDLNLLYYSCEEIHESSGSLLQLLVSWITYKQLGHNQHALVDGICRALHLVGE